MFKKKNDNSPETPADNAAAPEVDKVMNDAETAPETAPELTPEQEIDALKAALAEQQSKYLYLQAEYQNYRKRAARDISDTRVNTVAATLMPFLSVVDFLGMAEAAAEKSDNLEALKQGLKMIIGEVNKALDELNVKKIDASGAAFDPAIHEAMGYEASESVPEGQVIRQWNSGFKLGEHLLRPARVMVSSGAPAPETNDDANAENK